MGQGGASFEKLPTAESYYQAVVIGGSAGGMEALIEVFSCLGKEFSIPIILAQHLHKTDDGRFANHLNLKTLLSVTEAKDKEPVKPGRVYVAPADYHLLVERQETLALSVDPKVNWARPSIDVLFESAARVWGQRLVGVMLSGANSDGAQGLKLVVAMGGLALVQDPETAESKAMPWAAAQAIDAKRVYSPAEIGDVLKRVGSKGKCK